MYRCETDDMSYYGARQFDNRDWTHTAGGTCLGSSYVCNYQDGLGVTEYKINIFPESE